ncbi:hypothetical protein KIN20_032993 [Parelaphostrongylus tenuis]|uniref:Uncharacterized protein n=1 Tax=Parelaphostrongylus tenuis TaxID=148309 RepID=A0AAD5R7T6_PARTN|nr:hypothetical protein KIN20_032993 [Parelaphostrongylus tenuis]
MRNKNKRSKETSGGTDEGSAIIKSAKNSDLLPVPLKQKSCCERVVKRRRRTMDPGPSLSFATRARKIMKHNKTLTFQAMQMI